jgi:hypothetical protein
MNNDDISNKRVEQIIKEAYHDGKWGTGSNGSTKPADVIDWHTQNMLQLITVIEQNAYNEGHKKGYISGGIASLTQEEQPHE